MITGYPELAAVLAAVALGLTAQPPLAWLAARQGINVLLAMLVFATAVTIEPGALRRLAWAPLLAALGAGITVLPALSWAVSRMVAAGSLRDGIMAMGLAPCEIASVATTAMAGGETAVSAAVLIGSTVLTVVVAGPLLTLEAGRGDISSGHVIANLALVVAVPLAAGIALRACAPRLAPRAPTSRPAGAEPVPPPAGAEPVPWPAGAEPASWPAGTERAASAIALAAVAALVALIAAEVRLSARYLPVALALVVFLAGSALAGRLIGVRARRPAAVAVLLTTSMRDFAIAAGLAAAAFGPAAAAPLGLYGVLVMVWGTAAAGRLRRYTEP